MANGRFVVVQHSYRASAIRAREITIVEIRDVEHCMTFQMIAFVVSLTR